MTFSSPGLLADHGLPDGGGDGVARLGRGHDPLGAGELDGGGEALTLADGHGFEQSKLVDVREQGRHAVIAEATGGIGSGTKSCPRVCIFKSGVVPAVSPKS